MKTVCLCLAVLAFLGAFDTVLGDSAEWHYEGDMGPSNWAMGYKECGGRRQSPIDIRKAYTDAQPAEFFRVYAPILDATNMSLMNTGHSVQLDLSTRGIKVAGSTFPDMTDALQIHFHTPSEHAIEGSLYDMELHFVTQSIDRAVLGTHAPYVVVGLLFQAGGTVPNPLVERVISQLNVIKTATATTPIAFIPDIDFGNEFFEYEGSLTTPPCFEAVHWMVSTTIRNATQTQINTLSTFLETLVNAPGNNRPVQNLNGRRISRRSMGTFGMAPYSSCATSSGTTGSSVATTTGSTTILNFAGMLDGCKN